MATRRQKRLIRRLTRRIARIEGALAAYDDVESDNELRGKVVLWATEHLEPLGIDVDADGDGAISEEELRDIAEELADLIDDKVPLPEPFDTMMDLGVRLLSDLIVGIILRRRKRLERRLERKKARLARVKQRAGLE